jgi:hypothetical protein
MANPLPDPSVPVVNDKGLISEAWYRYFQSREKVGLANLPDVTITAIADGEVLVWVAADNKFENGSN